MEGRVFIPRKTDGKGCALEGLSQSGQSKAGGAQNKASRAPGSRFPGGAGQIEPRRRCTAHGQAPELQGAPLVAPLRDAGPGTWESLDRGTADSTSFRPPSSRTPTSNRRAQSDGHYSPTAPFRPIRSRYQWNGPPRNQQSSNRFASPSTAPATARHRPFHSPAMSASSTATRPSAAKARASGSTKQEDAQKLEVKEHDFFWTYTEEPHRTRRMAILKAHPEV